jgi:hypothetical protein
MFLRMAPMQTALKISDSLLRERLQSRSPVPGSSVLRTHTHTEGRAGGYLEMLQHPLRVWPVRAELLQGRDIRLSSPRTFVDMRFRAELNSYTFRISYSRFSPSTFMNTDLGLPRLQHCRQPTREEVKSRTGATHVELVPRHLCAHHERPLITAARLVSRRKRWSTNAAWEMEVT